MDDARIDELRQEYEHLSRDFFRVLAIASKGVEPSGEPPSHGRDDEKDLILVHLRSKKIREQFEGDEK
jgi:magnesium-transporting ATPase (P-type)